MLSVRNLLILGILGLKVGFWHQVSADDDEISCHGTHDFIVVGAGPGGGVVASRLAEAGYETLLLDAGPDTDGVDTQTPVLWPLATINPDLEWAFRVKTDEQSDVLYPRSSNIGGCALHNAMQAAYPYPDFFTELSALTGEEEFAEDKMRQRFIKIEKNEYGIPGFPLGPTGHGTEGFTSTSFGDQSLVNGDEQFGAVFGWLGTTVATGPQPFPDAPPNVPITYNPDINGIGGNALEGLHFCPVSISPSEGYKRSGVYGLIKDTEAEFDSLTIQPNSFVTKILFETDDSDSSDDDAKPKAIGINVREGTSLYSASKGQMSAGVEKTYCAKKEVIISGGAFNTPQILKISGIGPEQELQALNIDVVADLPGVGKNLKDKLEVTLNFQMSNPWKIFQDLGAAGCSLSPSPTNPCFLDYINGTFPSVFTSSGVFFSIMKKSDASTQLYPDLYIQASPSRFERYEDGWVQQSLSVPDVFTLNTATATSSSGEVNLRSDDPFEQAIIDFDAFDDDDVTKIATLVQELSAIMGAGSLNGIFGAQQLRPTLADLATLDATKAWVRQNGWGHHACCTAKIGIESDEDAVLDGKFRVRKVKNLRVVDASAFPKQPGFFPTIPIMMLAEKAADDIIAHWTAAESSDE